MIDPVTAGDKGPLVKMKGMVEKPPVEQAPSRLKITGRYILQPEVFELLATQTPGAGGEIQLTDAMITLSMNCDAMLEDVSNAEKLLKKIKTKDVSVKGTTADLASLKQHFLDVKNALERLKQNAKDFLTAKNRELLFKEMNTDYSNVLGTLTELMTESV